MRCVDDPALFTKSQSSDEHQSTISEGSEEESDEEEADGIGSMKTFRNPLSNIAQKSPYDEQVVKQTLLNPPPLPAAMMKRRNSFDPIGEEDEDDEEAEVAISSDEEVEPKKPYFEDPQKPYVESKEKIPSMRQGAQKSNQKHQKPGNKQMNNGCFKCG